MANFKTKLFGLAGTAMMFSGMAFGQLCNSTGTPAGTITLNPVGGAPFIRQEGQTELLPPLLLTCTNPGTLAATLNVNLYLSPALTITSKPNGSNTVEASLSITGTPATFVLGSVVGSALTFTGLSVPPGNASFTISNIRVNASALPGGVAGSIPTGITAQAFISGTGVAPGTSGTPTVAYASNGFVGSTKAFGSQALSGSAVTTSLGVCSSLNSSTSSNSGTTVTFYVSVAEGFSNAFKGQAEENSTAPGAVAANSGTRIKLIFNGVPAGVNLYVPTSTLAVSGGATITDRKSVV